MACAPRTRNAIVRYCLPLCLACTPALAGGPITCLVPQDAELLPSVSFNDQDFGASVDLSGDTMIVGAPIGSLNGTGAAFVFVRSGPGSDVWTQQATLVGTVITDGANCGNAVAIDGDTAVVAARRDDTPGVDSGAVYVFVRSGSVWTEQAKLEPADLASQDAFGWSVDIDGDSIIVGSPFDDDGATSAGAAYVFTRSGTTWTQEAKLTILGAGANLRLGEAVAIDGNTAVATSLHNSTFVFVRSITLGPGSWSVEADLEVPGTDIQLEDDTVVVGYESSVPNGTTTGAGWVFTRTAGAWTEQAHLFAPDGLQGDNFGTSAALSGNIAVFGASFDDTAAANHGSAYVFVRSGAPGSETWTGPTKLYATDGTLNAHLGTAVAVSGDTIVACAPDHQHTPGVFAGSAYVYRIAEDCNGSGTVDVCELAGHDSNGSGVLDECEQGACCNSGGGCAVEFLDECGPFVCNAADHLPGTFASCYGDVDGNGVVNPGDRGIVSANIGQTAREIVCVTDLDGNGIINAADRGFVSANIGTCSALPDFQNGSGMNGGSPDTRFGTSTFMGVGTTCESVSCP